MKYYMAIYDKDTIYGKRLADYLNLASDFPFITGVCTTKDEIRNFCLANKPKVILANEKLLSDIKPEAEELIILSDKKTGKVNDQNYVFKYQSGEKIIREILRILSDSDTVGKISSRKNRLKIISGYSPIKRSKSTSLCLSMGQILSEKYKTLYINLECFSGLAKRLNRDFSKNLGDLLYFTESKKSGFDMALAGIVEKVGNLDILASFDNQADLISVEESKWMELLSTIESETDYEYLILDISEAVKGMLAILALSDFIITTVDSDETSIQKLTQYEECIKRAGFEDIIAKTRKCNIPDNHRSTEALNGYRAYELEDYAKNVLSGILRDEKYE